MTHSATIPIVIQPLENVKALKDMYQHAIPRFILRQFGIMPNPLLSLKPSKAFTWRTSKSSSLPVNFYKVSTGQLSIRGLGNVYGKMNLYRNLKESEDVDYLEHKLASLENEASIAIKAIHVGIPSGFASLSRAELARLRKFILLMDYRSVANSASYFHGDNRLNIPLADLLKKFGRTHELQTETDVWQAGLKYYLDTPHHEIVAAGELLRDKYGNHQPYERPQFDPELEEWFTINYESQVDYYFLGIWEAAEGNEFILSDNSFSLREGFISDSPGAHKICVVSPRIALVLRRTRFHKLDPTDPSVVSTLVNVPISRPEFTYAQDFLQGVDRDDPTMIATARSAYRTSPEAQNDKFSFRYTKLSAQETYSVNEVILLNANVEQNGSITFSSSQAMINTLQRYMALHNTDLGEKKQLFRPLLTELVEKPNKVKKRMLSNPKSECVSSDANYPLNILLRSVTHNRVEFSSTYTRAYLVYHMAIALPSPSSYSLRIRRIRDNAIKKLQFLPDRPLHTLPSSGIPATTSSRSRKLVDTLSKAESETFFVVIGHLVDSAPDSNDLLANIIYEASLIGVTYWLMQAREDVLLALLGSRLAIFA
ncbi:hypothetical protein CPB83DRAFT_894642 [Crepidotus variabilis]|uniref:Uncharacterized protein n=1 Tax=Crepidotus variabilis TaxID=179855 RepID=A0A9P6EEQ3_9AGAR|nr:hypothetical protein CPB83DRAFT_894642 [Crepidotus variabilis]